MTKRQQRRAEKAQKKNTTPNQTKQAPKITKTKDVAKHNQLEKFSGIMKGILKIKQEQEEKELMWKLINKYEDEVWRAFTPYS